MPDDYFRVGVFAHPHRGQLFNRFTCIACGHHSPTWEGFLAHRLTCPGPGPATAGDPSALREPGAPDAASPGDAG